MLKKQSKLADQLVHLCENSSKIVVTRAEIEAKITGRVTGPDQPGGKVIHQGGDVVGVTMAFLEDLDPEQVKRNGDDLYFNGLHLRMFAFYPELELVLARVIHIKERDDSGT